jgi:hypothetical protein
VLPIVAQPDPAVSVREMIVVVRVHTRLMLVRGLVSLAFDSLFRNHRLPP